MFLFFLAVCRTATAESYADDDREIQCSMEDKIYEIHLNIHSDQAVIQAIKDTSEHSFDRGAGTTTEALEDYFGYVNAELNKYLQRFKVQIKLGLNAESTKTFIDAYNSKQSCEVKDPVIAMTSEVFSYVKNSYDNNIGIQLFIFSCIYIDERAELHTVFNNEMCGRVIGVIWKGREETKILLRNAIMDALTGLSNTVSDSFQDDLVISGHLCSFVSKCVGMGSSAIGQIIYENSSESTPSAIEYEY